MPFISRRGAWMRFVEIDLFGVYVAPISLMMVMAWIVTIALRRRRPLWPIALCLAPRAFCLAVYTIVLSSIVLAIAAS